MKTAATVLALIVALPAFAATRARYLMGTVCEVSAGDERQIEAAFAEAARVEAMLSTWRDDSELARYNADRSTPLSPELASLLRVVDEQRIRSGGAFDPRIRPLIDAWKTREEGAVPDPSTIANALAHRDTAPIEEGAFGKGYALDRMLAVILSREAGEGPPSLNAGGPSASARLRMTEGVILNFGGQLLVRGTHEVTIADPEHRDRPLIRLTLRDASLSTSSGSEKTFVLPCHPDPERSEGEGPGGRAARLTPAQVPRYARNDTCVFTHILDPRSGEALPPRGSVSVIDGSALLADIESTALYVMGAEDGLRWADANGVAALFIGRDGTAHASRTFPKFNFIKD